MIHVAGVDLKKGRPYIFETTEVMLGTSNNKHAFACTPKSGDDSEITRTKKKQFHVY